MARVMQAVMPATGRGGSIALEMTDDAIAAEIGGGIVTTEMGTGQRSAEEDQGRDQGIVITTANILTDIAHGRARENTTGGTDRGVASVDVRTIVIDHRGTASMTAQEVQDEMRGVAIAAEAAAGHLTSIRDHAGEASIEWLCINTTLKRNQVIDGQ
jgi:hypothetical protein